MKVLLKRDARILHKAGETVEVSPAEAGFLLSVGSAVAVAAGKKPDSPAKPKQAKKK
jgi:ribosomal protein L9